LYKNFNIKGALMKNGFRVPPQPSKKEQQRKTDTELQNLQMSVRISQMMLQQVMQNMKSMGEDLGSALNQLYELQYKYSALQKHLSLDTKALDKIANEQRLKDFDEASAKADERDQLETADVVSADSVVTITSTAQDESGQDKGIFRSRLKLSDSGVPELISQLTGKKVTDKVTVTLNGLSHEIELLSIKNPKVKEASETQTQEVTH
jgi:hypothetical protein